MKIKNLFALVLMVVALSSCSMRLVDFTVISSKNVNLEINRTQGKKVKGKKTYFLGIGWNIKDAMDKALESAGPEYDLLVDGVVRYGSYPFVASVTVEGTAVSSRSMKNKLGEAGFKEWLNGKKLAYDKQTEIVYADKKK
ncbi:hypothetical protein ACE1MK_05340 [Tenacibaculum maritimum]|uniref:hypothetical protein n=2 Tax=Tenacibaculum maritimum TaxID=107401 RepID=UPI0012E5F3B2|nr:hypothetical protein [Tenacibaculum maritimum]CAA0230739.1 conserved exported hypothetical protein [Tenacibaculum maritimum]CAA0251012.1 conserved exported hypothetical protein [Tenacibaculum maritimum]